jgi:hypothetical protein
MRQAGQKRRGRRAPLAAGLVALSLTGACRPEGNPLLSELAAEDQAERTGGSPARSDADRIMLVLAELGAGRVSTPEDRFNAALVLNHSPLTIRDGELAAVSPDNYLLAHHLASAAFDSGHANARTLVAQTIDRYLSLTAGYQKYGTNRFINQRTGVEELAPIDRDTPDSERARYGVPPLEELLKQFPEATRDPP